jgi:ABC-2 type transport system ATP-binding protein
MWDSDRSDQSDASDLSDFFEETMQNQDNAIEVTGLRKTFGALTAVEGVDFQVRPGEIFGLVGPDGAGKTTTMRLLAGLIDPDAGSMRVGGYDVQHETEAMQRQIGYMPQRFSLYGDLTVAENMRFYATIYHVPRAERLARQQRLLEFSRLEPFLQRQAQYLSGGMKQKLALACVLMHTPRVLFLDEPTTGVDPVSRRDFWKILYTLLQEGVTLFVSTPYMDEAERCTRVALMNKGRLILCDTPARLKEHLPGEMLEVIVEPLRPAKKILARMPGVRDVQLFGDRLHVQVANAAAAEPAITAALTTDGMTLGGMRRVAPGLEDVFVSLLGDTSSGEPHGSQ